MSTREFALEPEFSTWANTFAADFRATSSIASTTWLRGDVMDHVPNPVQDLQRAIRNRPSQPVRLFGFDNLVAISRHDRNRYREAAILCANPACVRDHSCAVQGARAESAMAGGP